MQHTTEAAVLFANASPFSLPLLPTQACDRDRDRDRGSTTGTCGAESREGGAC